MSEKRRELERALYNLVMALKVPRETDSMDDFEFSKYVLDLPLTEVATAGAELTADLLTRVQRMKGES